VPSMAAEPSRRSRRDKKELRFIAGYRIEHTAVAGGGRPEGHRR